MRLFSVFGLVALLELATFLWVESRIGLGWALGLAFITAIIGSQLVRRAGLAVWRRFRRRIDSGEVPGRELSDGATVLVAGAFLISPGFVTDILGFVLLLPGAQERVFQMISARFRGKLGFPSSRKAEPDPGVIDVEGWEASGLVEDD